MDELPRNRPAYLQLVAISWNFGWPIVAGVAVGHWLDDRFGTSPAVALALGLGAMIAAVWRLVVLGKQDAAERREADGEGDGNQQ